MWMTSCLASVMREMENNMVTQKDEDNLLRWDRMKSNEMR